MYFWFTSDCAYCRDSFHFNVTRKQCNKLATISFILDTLIPIFWLFHHLIRLLFNSDFILIFFWFSYVSGRIIRLFFLVWNLIFPWKITKTRKIRENNKKYLEILSVTSCKILVKYRLTQETSIYFGFVPDKVHEISRPPSKFRCIAGRPWPQVGIFSESLHGNETL